MATHRERLLAEAIVKIAKALGTEEAGPLTGPEVLLLAEGAAEDALALREGNERLRGRVHDLADQWSRFGWMVMSADHAAKRLRTVARDEATRPWTEAQP